MAFCDFGSRDLFDLLDFKNAYFCRSKMVMRSCQSFFMLTERNGKRVRRFVLSTVFLLEKHIQEARVLHSEDIANFSSILLVNAQNSNLDVKMLLNGYENAVILDSRA